METPEQGQIGGCMAGFFNIFDRPHLLSPKRLSEPAGSPLDSRNQREQSVVMEQGSSSRSPWRFSKEAPRLSLDSRAVVDAKGSLKPRQIRRAEASGSGSGSPSVIARLMGLETLPSAPPPLQRCASESRVCRFEDSFNFQNRDEEISGSDAHTPARDPPPPHRHVVPRKCFFDSADFFPEPRQSKVSGSDAHTTDLETLKQLVEALRLKGLMHSSTNKAQGNKNLVLHNHPSPIKPPCGIIRSVTGARAGVSPSTRPRREDQSKGRSPNRRPTHQRSHSRRKPEINRGGPNECSKQADKEMWKVADCNNRQGKTLLERCDKLLHSIAEMAAAEAAVESQPSPVSVLDASIYHDESSPSPIMKRSLDFESWGGSISPSSDAEYVYISDILRASDNLPQDSDIFSLLEKQQYLRGKCVSRAETQERRLIFDAVQEIVGQRRRLPPWRMVAEADKMQLIWSQFQKTRTKLSSTEEEDLLGYVCGLLGKDLSEDHRWHDCQVEISEAVLDIERLVFKDLIGETIRHMAPLTRSGSLRRRLLF